ncbi:c-type cytochrome [Blattabacterium cuenoti]|uniref:c-type cytochrome n=1 Tax=Blattabacterium cuenoti TaxID=1653831 RepID=UPI00163D0E7B|nr:c-type cytochrome [Blattabacterium cuenoti]
MKKSLFSIFIVINILFSCIKAKEDVQKIEGNAEKGIDLFKKNCTACHSLDLEKKMIGPALYGITKKRNREWLHRWIKDNKSLRKSGDKDAISIYQEFGNIEMNSFPKLSEKQIDDILFFIENPITKKKEITNDIEKNENTENEILEKKFLIKLIFLCFSILSLIILWILYRIYILTRLLNEGEEPIFTKTDFFLKKIYNRLGNSSVKWKSLSCFLGLFLFFCIYQTWLFSMKIDVNKGYKPEQPIYFSHKIHSGINEIDCEYCHSSAKNGKTSGIPSINVCMNCHITIEKYNGDYIEKGKSREEYNREIQKIYHSIGFDPSNREYSRKIYPVKWIRIHNMPDFVYFDHSQHIISGEKSIKKLKKVNLVCNACHGEVQKMDQTEMYNDFTMEWCISCHRQAEIDKENKYYKKYFSKKIKENKKITIGMIGGIECAKCHY